MSNPTNNQVDSLILIVNGKRIMDMPDSEDRFIANPVGRVTTTDVNVHGKVFHAITNSRKFELSIKVIQGSDDDVYLKALCELFYSSAIPAVVDYTQPLLKKAGVIVNCSFTVEPQDQFGTGNYIKEYTLSGVGVKS